MVEEPAKTKGTTKKGADKPTVKKTPKQTGKPEKEEEPEKPKQEEMVKEVNAAGYCGSCGERMKSTAAKICPNCGSDPKMGVEYCPHCGEKLKSKNAKICMNCGCELKPSKKEEKNPTLAAILSFFIVGLGQIYNGQIMKGIILFLAHGGMWVVAFLLSIVYFIGCFLMPIPLIIYIYSIYDAYKTAERINAGEKVKDMEW